MTLARVWIRLWVVDKVKASPHHGQDQDRVQSPDLNPSMGSGTSPNPILVRVRSGSESGSHPGRHGLN